MTTPRSGVKAKNVSVAICDVYVKARAPRPFRLGVLRKDEAYCPLQLLFQSRRSLTSGLGMLRLQRLCLVAFCCNVDLNPKP